MCKEETTLETFPNSDGGPIQGFALENLAPELRVLILLIKRIYLYKYAQIICLCVEWKLDHLDSVGI